MKLKSYLFLILTLVLVSNSWATETPAPTAPTKNRCRLSYALLGTLLVPGAYAAVEHVTTDPDSAQTEGFNAAPEEDRLDVYVMGDSMASGNMAYGTAIQTIQRTRSPSQIGWVLDLDKKENGLDSLYDRYSKKYETRVTNAAWPGAYADGEAIFVDRTMANLTGSIQNFSQQVKRLNKLMPSPNLVIISLFNNNLDFKFNLEKKPKLERESHLEQIPKSLIKEYRKQIESIIQNRKSSKNKLSILLLSSMNYETALKARDKAREMHKEDPKQFPHFEMADTNFPSTLPENQEEFIQLSKKVNSELALLAKELSAEIKDRGLESQIQMFYSDSLDHLDLSDVSALHPDDGLHTSLLTKQQMADTVEKDLTEALQFLGPKSK